MDSKLIQKVKILCLHGFKQNPERLSSQLEPIIKSFKDTDIELSTIIPMAPFQMRNDYAMGEQKEFCWLYFDQENQENFTQEFKKEKTNFMGWPQSREKLHQILQENEDIQVLFGFSQGALIASILLAERQLGGQKILKNLKCAILISGVGRPSPENEELNFTRQFVQGKKLIDIPSLHIMGEKDVFIPNQDTEKMRNWYNKELSQVYVHPGSHFIPVKKENLQVYQEFILKNVAEKL